jgi:hypothetical protein
VGLSLLPKFSQLEGAPESLDGGCPHAIHRVGGHELNNREAILDMGSLKLLCGFSELLAGWRVSKGSWVSPQSEQAACRKVLQCGFALIHRRTNCLRGAVCVPVARWFSLKQQQGFELVVGGDVLEQELS